MRGSLLRASAWMVGLSIVLFWLPVLGPLVAGFVGGREAVTFGKATVAALVPSILVALLVWALLAAFDLPVIGALAGGAVGIAVALQDVPLFVGAWLGAAMVPDRPR